MLRILNYIQQFLLLKMHSIRIFCRIIDSCGEKISWTFFDLENSSEIFFRYLNIDDFCIVMPLCIKNAFCEEFVRKLFFYITFLIFAIMWNCTSKRRCFSFLKYIIHLNGYTFNEQCFPFSFL